MKKTIIDRVLLVLLVVSVIIELGVTVGFVLLANMDVNRFRNEIEINIVK